MSEKDYYDSIGPETILELLKKETSSRKMDSAINETFKELSDMDQDQFENELKKSSGCIPEDLPY